MSETLQTCTNMNVNTVHKAQTDNYNEFEVNICYDHLYYLTSYASFLVICLVSLQD